MIRKTVAERQPKKSLYQRFKKLGKIGAAAIAFELLCTVAVYGFYRRTNRDPELRYKLVKGEYRSPGLYWLEYYYKLGEFMDSSLDQRKGDLEYWRATGKDI
jgi:hypothetical protein